MLTFTANCAELTLQMKQNVPGYLHPIERRHLFESGSFFAMDVVSVDCR